MLGNWTTKDLSPSFWTSHFQRIGIILASVGGGADVDPSTGLPYVGRFGADGRYWGGGGVGEDRCRVHKPAMVRSGR